MSGAPQRNGGLPAWLRQEIEICPTAGSGVHDYQFRVARLLARHWAPDEIFTFLRTQVTGCGRHVSEAETWRQVNRGLQADGRRKVRVAPGAETPKWPLASPEFVSAFEGEAAIKAGDLRDLSPSKLKADRTSRNYLESLFPGNPLLCCGRYLVHNGETVPSCRTRSLSEWGARVNDLELIVPSTMTNAFGVNQDGRKSHRCLNNTGSRRFLVVEFDCGTYDQQASRIWRLSRLAPLVMVVWSGGKSLHSWWSATAAAESELEKFFRLAVSVGADPHGWCRCQLMRMPQGLRSNGSRQRVVYFDEGRIPR
jgi:hypothetical protein